MYSRVLTFLYFRVEIYLSIQLVSSSVADATVLAVNKLRYEKHERKKQKKKETEKERESRTYQTRVVGNIHVPTLRTLKFLKNTRS